MNIFIVTPNLIFTLNYLNIQVPWPLVPKHSSQIRFPLQVPLLFDGHIYIRKHKLD
jgi:hypothetical protein